MGGDGSEYRFECPAGEILITLTRYLFVIYSRQAGAKRNGEICTKKDCNSKSKE